MAVAETARLIAELSLDDKLSPKVKTALGSVNKLETGLARVGKGAGQVSAGLATAGTRIAAGIGVGLAGAAKAAIDWEDAFAGVVKTVDEADLSKAGLTFRDLELGLRNLATEMPNTAQELAGIAEQAGALGIAGKDIQAFTKQVAILASTTNVSAEDAATALGQLQNVIGLTGDEFDNFAASLVDLGNKGASTEGQILEIARRAGGAAKLFGIAKDETLGWAAAAANLGLNEELAGTALQNVFVKLMPKYTSGSKQLQKITGQTAKQLKKAFKDDAGGAIEGLIAQLGEMPKDQRLQAVQDLFGKGSGITRLVLGLADSYKTNLAPSLETATESWEEATAAQIEFDKRNATVRSSISRLRNGIIDAAITVGEGFVPALGRASDKLGAFLKQDKNRQALTDLGKQIGDAIDKIDWNQVLSGVQTFASVMKVAFDWAKRLFDVINALPTEIKAAGLGFLGLNKLSGGLLGAGVGNIVSGALGPLLRNLGSQLPGVGKAFVQPVLVTNWPPTLGAGGGGGVAGAAGKGGGLASKLGGALSIAAIVSSVAAVVQTQQEQSSNSSAQAAAIKAGLDSSIAGKSLPELKTALAGVDQGIRDLQSNPLLTLVQGDALTTLQTMKGDLQTQIGKLDTLHQQANRTKDDTIAATERVARQNIETKRETVRGLSLVRDAQRSSAAGISAAIRAKDLSVTTKTNVNVRVNTSVRFSISGLKGAWRASDKVGHKGTSQTASGGYYGGGR